MGFYLNPREGKEEWLSNNAAKVSVGEAEAFSSWGTEALLVHVDNGSFTALGVAYDPSERTAFIEGRNGRGWQWYTANRKIVEKELGAASPWRNEK